MELSTESFFIHYSRRPQEQPHPIAIGLHRFHGLYSVAYCAYMVKISRKAAKLWSMDYPHID